MEERIESPVADLVALCKPVRYVHEATGALMVKLSAGDVYVTTVQESITTVLGSCISVCVRHPKFGIGGMNHFMLPGSQSISLGGEKDGIALAGRYGYQAMQALVRSVLQLGGTPADLEAKVFGGASVMELSSDIGAANVAFACQYLRDSGIPVLAQDVGFEYPRKIIYDPLTGKVALQRLRSVYRGYVIESERRALNTLRTRNGKAVVPR